MEEGGLELQTLPETAPLHLPQQPLPHPRATSPPPACSVPGGQEVTEGTVASHANLDNL